MSPAPELVVHQGLGIQQAAIEARLRRESCRMAVLHDVPIVDDQYAVEISSLADIMRDAEKGRAAEGRPQVGEELGPLAAVKSAERLVEESKGNAGLDQGPRQPDALAFPARHECATLAKCSLQACGKCLDDAAHRREIHRPTDAVQVAVRRRVKQVFEKRRVPELHGRVNPGGAPPQLRNVSGIDWLSVNLQSAS